MHEDMPHFIKILTSFNRESHLESATTLTHIITDGYYDTQHMGIMMPIVDIIMPIRLIIIRHYPSLCQIPSLRQLVTPLHVLVSSLDARQFHTLVDSKAELYLLVIN